MNIQYRFKVGQSEFTLTLDVENEKDFFKQVSFYSSLPSVGPNGEDDLQITFRTAGKYTYYSLVSQKAQQEFAFGQHLEGNGLFPKGWQPLYKANQDSSEAQEPHASTTDAAKPVAAPKAATPAPTLKVSPKPSVGLQTPPAVTSAVPAPAVSPKVSQSAASTLARFNIKQ
jgi:hypothetical protein